MTTHSKHTAHGIFKDYMYHVLDFLHCLISVTIIVAIVLTLFSLPQQLLKCLDVESKSLIHFLEYVINVIIAVELIHVLLHQSLDTIVEILSLAITRELIIQQLHTYEIFIGIAAIALLFVIRKYLYISGKDKERKNITTYASDLDEEPESEETGGPASAAKQE